MNMNEYVHFIIGRPISAIPEPAILDISDNRLSRWQYTTKCVQTIWKRWKNDYLNHLQQRNKWKFEKNNVAVGCLVLLKENDLPPCKWAMARILEVFYGTDGKEENCENEPLGLPFGARNREPDSMAPIERFLSSLMFIDPLSVRESFRYVEGISLKQKMDPKRF
ncbi:integrase catalytic domain-containing protein [Trichonephila clavipes]|nr:integrase catalytic domain-containing protein [Trichonephila clavipes]